MGDASAQEVERHVGNPSTGPTLRTEREMLDWSAERVEVLHLSGFLQGSPRPF